MPTLNFQPRFAPLVESGEKRCTIRAYRKDGRDPKPGDTLYHYVGLRTKQCQKLREDECLAAWKITITHDDFLFTNDRLMAHERDWMAQRDGFTDWAEMVAWFDKTHGLPFSGLLIEW